MLPENPLPGREPWQQSPGYDQADEEEARRKRAGVLRSWVEAEAPGVPRGFGTEMTAEAWVGTEVGDPVISLLQRILDELQNPKRGDVPQGVAWGPDVYIFTPPFTASTGLIIFPTPLYSLVITNNYSNAFQYRIPGDVNSPWVRMPAVTALGAGIPGLADQYSHHYSSVHPVFRSIMVQPVPNTPATSFQFWLRGWY